MKRTLVPERDTCSLYGFQLDKRARFGDSDSYSRTLQVCLPEQSERYLIYCILLMGLLTFTSRDFKNSMFLYMDPTCISEESVEILFLSDLPSSNARSCFSSFVQAKI